MNHCFVRPTRHILLVATLAAFAVTICGSRGARARAAGIDSSQFAPTLSNGCNNCHTTATVAPTVALTASSSTLTPGQQITLVFVVTSNNAPTQKAAGFNIRSSQRGTFASVAGDTSTRPIANLATTWLEATHSAPKNNDAANKATFTVLWTPNAGVNGTVTFTAWGNSVDKMGTNQNDRAASTTLDVTVCTPTTWYRDSDADSYGNPSNSMSACTQPPGFVANNTDCNDGSAAIHPGATEICNAADDNCNGMTDEGVTGTFYRDGDGDGYGNASASAAACTQPGGYVANNTDCNDASAAVHPGAAEACNGVDDNCDGSADNGLAMMTFYRDADGDGHGVSTLPKTACSLAVAGAGYVADNTDCDDSDRNTFPGAAEICGNHKDDNCNGVVDTDAPASSTFYRDVDGDGYGSVSSGTAMACAPPAGYVSNNTDCNDGDVAVHPGAAEVCNGKDDNCAGGADEGLGSTSCGEGPCRTMVAACVGGVPQTCTPVCPDAGAAKDAETRDGSSTDPPKDGSPPLDALPGDVSTADTASPPNDAPVSTVRDSGATKSDAKLDGGLRDGANADTDENGDSGCSCRMSSRSRGWSAPLGAVGLAVLLLTRRRRRAG